MRRSNGKKKCARDGDATLLADAGDALEHVVVQLELASEPPLHTMAESKPAVATGSGAATAFCEAGPEFEYSSPLSGVPIVTRSPLRPLDDSEEVLVDDASDDEEPTPGAYEDVAFVSHCVQEECDKDGKWMRQSQPTIGCLRCPWRMT